MDDPLENDVKRGPEEEVGDSEPGEPLQERERETSETGMLRAECRSRIQYFFSHQLAVYQAVQGSLAQQENGINRVHPYQQLPQREITLNG
jgi:hypothetical protein